MSTTNIILTAITLLLAAKIYSDWRLKRALFNQVKALKEIAYKAIAKAQELKDNPDNPADGE